MPRLRIGLLTAWDSRNARPASGIPYYMARALARNGAEVVHLGPALSWRELWSKVKNRAQRALGRKPRPYTHGLAAAREYARVFSRRLAGVEVLFAPMSSTQVALLETALPIVYTSDTTWRLLCDYYPEYTGLDQRYRAEADEIERRAIVRADLLPYPSRWVADSVIGAYRAAPNRVHVVPWGANLEDVPPAEALVPAKPLDRCELLFLGRDWERKGGPLAYQTVLALRAGGLEARLTVCGCRPTGAFEPAALRLLPPVDKSDAAQRRMLQRLFLGSSFLLQPTRHESLGLTYCEASAHGTPSIATDTGGVSGVVTDGENGFLLPPAAGAQDYARLILDLFRDQPRYRDLVAASRRAYDTRLNWDTWARSITKLIAGLL